MGTGKKKKTCVAPCLDQNFLFAVSRILDDKLASM
jgi:hypothetical protein